jgi:hypothetical protein
MNKKFTVCWVIAFLMLSVKLFAQDVLITKDADTVNCKITGITDELIMFRVPESDKESKVPVSALHKYLFRMEWQTVGALNPSAFDKKKIDVQKAFVGNVRTAGFHIQRAAQYQLATPLLSLGSIGFIVGGGLQLTDKVPVNRALIATGCILGAAAIATQIISARHLKKAGMEFQFVPIKEPIKMKE